MQEKFTRYGLFKGMLVGFMIEALFVMAIIGLFKITCIVL